MHQQQVLVVQEHQPFLVVIQQMQQHIPKSQKSHQVLTTQQVHA
jgi:hypothetical protein